MRQQVSNELVETINEFGPKMFEDFDEARCICLWRHICYDLTVTLFIVAYPRPFRNRTPFKRTTRHLAAQECHRRRRRTGQSSRPPNGQSRLLAAPIVCSPLSCFSSRLGSTNASSAGAAVRRAGRARGQAQEATISAASRPQMRPTTRTRPTTMTLSCPRATAIRSRRARGPSGVRTPTFSASG